MGAPRDERPYSALINATLNSTLIVSLLRILHDVTEAGLGVCEQHALDAGGTDEPLVGLSRVRRMICLMLTAATKGCGHSLADRLSSAGSIDATAETG